VLGTPIMNCFEFSLIRNIGRPNQPIQPAAGRFDTRLHFMKTRPLQATPALDSGD
jgi:hypothetical protein